MNIPENCLLPFFAYGTFKLGQICHYRIRNYIQLIDEVYIPGILKERDALPLFEYRENSHNAVLGQIITFKPGQEEEAYNKIIEIEPQEVYKWGEVRFSDDKLANTLIGKKLDRGAVDYEEKRWDGTKDPYFNEALDEIEKILKNENGKYGYIYLMHLQMGYFLLWSSIERYAALRYNLSHEVNKKIDNIASEKSFQIGLENTVKERREIFSSVDLKRKMLDPQNPQLSLKYYYAVRSNSVHRGKAVFRDILTLEKSCKELLSIFRIMLEYAWKNE